MSSRAVDLRSFEDNAVSVAAILRALSNERRLLILCKLAHCAEANVSELTEAVGLSQSMLSQHLAKLRDEQLVALRRESQTLRYRIADRRIERLLQPLDWVFCQMHKERRGSS
jgi:ArsR family transcriptional regulator, virulence genes transcriptional regulator